MAQSKGVITEEQRKELAEYVAILKREMWLSQWRIDIVWDGDINPEAYATIHPTDGQRHANLRVCHDFFEMEPWKRRWVLAHELLHCYAADVQSLGESLRTNLGDQAYEAWHPGFNLAVEHMVDGLTTLIAGEDSTFLPLPESGDVVRDIGDS